MVDFLLGILYTLSLSDSNRVQITLLAKSNVSSTLDVRRNAVLPCYVNSAANTALHRLPHSTT